MMIFFIAALAACMAVFVGVSGAVLLFTGQLLAGFLCCAIAVAFFTIFYLALRWWDRQ